MSDIKLFACSPARRENFQGDASDLEKPLQTLIEADLSTLLGIRFLATEYSTGKTHAGRIDSLGLDENSCPVILEYKRWVGRRHQPGPVLPGLADGPPRPSLGLPGDGPVGRAPRPMPSTGPHRAGVHRGRLHQVRDGHAGSADQTATSS